MSAERKSVSASARSPAPARWQVGALRTSVQILLAICVVAGALWVFHRIQGVLLVLALSVLFTYLVAPVVSFFQTAGHPSFAPPRAMPVTLAIIAAYLTIFGTLAAAGTLILRSSPLSSPTSARSCRATSSGSKPPGRAG